MLQHGMLFTLRGQASAPELGGGTYAARFERGNCEVVIRPSDDAFIVRQRNTAQRHVAVASRQHDIAAEVVHRR